MKRIVILLLIICCKTFAQIPANVPANGLIGYWPFSGNANDASGNNNNGTVNGAAPTTDRFGNTSSAYNFNGTSNYIVVPNAPSLSGFNDISISAWVNMNQFSGIQGVVAKWFFTLSCGSNTDNYNASFSSNSINFATNNNNLSGFFCPQTFTSVDLNVWKHFVFVSNSTTGISIYINGVLSGTAATTGGICSSTNPLYFGAVNPSTRFLNGKLDDIGIWNRALTSCEIAHLYNGTALNVSTSNNSICAGNSATLTAGNGFTNYLWNTSATTSAIVVSPTTTTTYTLSATNVTNGCSYTTSIVQNVGALTLTVASSNSLICAGDPATLTVNGNATTFFWNTSSTNTFIVVSPTTTTSYTVFATNAVTGCTTTASITQNVSTCTSIHSNALNYGVKIYPNPTTDNFYIEMPDEIGFIEVTDMMSKNVYSSEMFDGRKEINLSQCKPGVYFIKIKTGQGIHIKKIIKE